MFLSQKWLALVVYFAKSIGVICIEEVEREIFLQPRNFNPHPYQAGFKAGIAANGNTGPVLFPETPPDPDYVDSNGNLRKSDVDRDNNKVLIDTTSNPYQYVVKKRKYKQPGGRFFAHNQESNANPQAFKALAAHGEKILEKSSSLLDVSDPSYSNFKKTYAFSYKVKDQESGDDFSHVQEQNAKATNGEYRVKLPDGRVQIVSYVADQNGYKADVKYTENEKSNPNPSEQIRPIQITESGVKSETGHYDYLYENYPSDSNSQTQLPLYREEEYATSQFPIYPTHNEQISVSGLKGGNLVHLIVTPATPKISATSTHENQLQINSYLVLQNQIQSPIDKVGLFQNSIHDQHKLLQINEHSLNSGKVERFIGSTLAPYTLDSSKGFQQNVLMPTFPPPDTGRYSQIHFQTPNFQYLHKHHGGLFYNK